MTYKSTLISVRDMEASRRFYREILGLDAVLDFGANVTLEGGLCLQTAQTFRDFLGGTDAVLPNHAGELYFEEVDFDGFAAKLQRENVPLVHPPKEHPWGQRAVRFYDPDGHIIEVGETLAAVARRFAAGGMTADAVARRMDIPIAYAKELLRA